MKFKGYTAVRDSKRIRCSTCGLTIKPTARAVVAHEHGEHHRPAADLAKVARDDADAAHEERFTLFGANPRAA